jgi:hypothetical protein
MSDHSQEFIANPEQFCPKLDTMLYAQKLSMSGSQESEVRRQKKRSPVAGIRSQRVGSIACRREGTTADLLTPDF